MRRLAVPPGPVEAEISSATPPPALDVELLLAKGGLILQREIQNLLVKSAGGKLPTSDARDLIAYVRLLNELKQEQQDELSKMTDAQLKELAK